MRVTPATADDIETVTDQWVALAAGQREHGSDLLADENRQAGRDGVARSVVMGELLVARADPVAERSAESTGDPSGPGPVIGFVDFSIDRGGLDRDDTRGVVDNLFVVPERRGEGVGSALLSAAERALGEAGATTVGLEAMAANDGARTFYRGRGYDLHRVLLTKPIDEDGSDGHGRSEGDPGGDS